MQARIRTFTCALLAALLAGCGGGGGGDTGSISGTSDEVSNPPPTPPSPTALVGVFLDAPVAGIRYRTASHSGLTSAQGEFQYEPGERVIFSVGAIDLPQVQAAARITPLDLAGTDDINHPIVSNLLVFLQSLDADADQSNGLQISAGAHGGTSSALDFSLPPEAVRSSSPLRDVMAASGSKRLEPITVAAATTHFQETLKRVNLRPVARAGANQSVTTSSTVILSGAQSSDANGDSLSYRWSIRSRPSGSAATLSGADSVSARFAADQPGQYEIDLVVRDGSLESDISTVMITATAGNAAPSANAGQDRTALVGATISLDGSRSIDADGDPLSYAWVLLSRPSGSSAALVRPEAVNPELTPDLEGNYVLRLVVSDGRASSDAAQVTVQATRNNVAPIARAGAVQAVLEGGLVTLDGSASSDANADSLSYLWSFVSRPPGSSAALSGASSVNPSFIADRAGSYVLALVVNDGQVSSTTSTTTVTASSANLAPVANAGPSRSAYVGTSVTLDGRASYDPNNDPLAFAWMLVSRPAGSTATLSGVTQPMPTLLPDLPGSYVVALAVGDGSLVSEVSTTTVLAELLPVIGPVDLLLFGGALNDQYLGCLTCNSFHAESVCNQFGNYGSPFNFNSIWNQFGTYGSPFNLYSPWNTYSISGPIIVGTDGLNYGRFTVNAFQYDRTTIPSLRNVLNFYSSTNNLNSTRIFACGN